MPSLESVMQSVVQAYRQGGNAINDVLSNPENKEMVKLWMKQHPHNSSTSPMLKDLKSRVEPLTDNSPVSEIYNQAMNPDLLSSAEIESRILEGKFQELKEYFDNHPKEFINHFDLIQLHLELGTLSLNREPKILLPLFLDNLSTEDLTTLLHELPDDSLEGLSNLQLLRLGQIVTKDESLDETLASQLPPLSKEFMNILKEPKDVTTEGVTTEDVTTALQKIQGLQNVTPNEKSAALTHYIEHHKVPLQDIKQQLSNDEFSNLIPHLRYLDLRGFTDLPLAQQIVKNCPNFYSLFISDAKILEGISALNNCERLSCYECPLTILPALDNCKYLNCNWCPNLRVLPALDNCERLYCSSCPNLRALPALNNCKELTCKSSPLTILPALNNCKEIDCCYCPLRALPALDNCERLYCSSCPNLRALPALNNCKVLFCRECPLEELPELPSDAQVYSDDTLEFTKLNVDIEKFSDKPIALLLQLGEYLLKNQPFPNVYYFEKGVPNEAIDIGGVRRDFVSRLSESVFKGTTDFVEGNFLLNMEGFPISHGSENDEKAFRTLGRLFALCYPKHSYFKTGTLFDEKVYALIQTHAEMEEDEWFLSNYLDLIEATAVVKQLVDLEEEAPKLSESDLKFLSTLTSEEESKYANMDDKAKREALRSELLENAKEDGKLKPISWMAQELESKIPKLEGNLQEKIEGKLSSEAIKEHFVWHSTSSPQETEKTKNFLNNWIDQHKDDKKALQNFMRVVTGNRALCPEKLQIHVYNRGNDYIPCSHTCSFALELSGKYKSQEVFNEKLEYFIKNALAGSGYTMA